MFELFTDRARRVVVNAQDESRSYNHDHIGSEHLLLGLLRDSDGLAARVARTFGITQDAVRQHVEEVIVRGEDAPSGHIPFDADAKLVLELALREAKDLGHNYIGTEHILLGLIRQGDGVAARILSKLGADLDTARSQVRRLLVTPTPTIGATTGATTERAVDRLTRIEEQLLVLGERLTAVERRLDGGEPSSRASGS